MLVEYFSSDSQMNWSFTYFQYHIKSGKNITGKIQFGQWTLRESKTFRNNICRLVYRFKE